MYTEELATPVTDELPIEVPPPSDRELLELILTKITKVEALVDMLSGVFDSVQNDDSMMGKMLGNMLGIKR